VAGGTADDRDYYYNDQWQLIVEVKDGSAWAIYHWHPFYVDALAARMRASDTHFFLHDANYNVTAAVDDSGNAVVERYSFTAYGEVTVLDADFTLDSDGGDGLSDIDNQHLYTGRERDSETGLQLNRHRFYAAHLGRWVNRDPIGYNGSPYNLYEYAMGYPHQVDPDGLCPPPPQQAVNCAAKHAQCINAAFDRHNACHNRAFILCTILCSARFPGRHGVVAGCTAACMVPYLAACEGDLQWGQSCCNDKLAECNRTGKWPSGFWYWTLWKNCPD
jgi:RHS repeat-associated protein